MNLHLAAKALGGDIAGRNSIVCPGPGHSRRDRSLSVTFSADDFTVYSHSGDDWKACKDHVRQRLGLGDFTSAGNSARVSAEKPVRPQSQHEDRERKERASTIWKEAVSMAGTPAETYLASRGVSYGGDELRWHPSCPFGNEHLGCMLGLVRNIVTNEPQAVHRTAINAQGRKIDRKAYGPIGGGAIKLTDEADVTNIIAIGEGIETALSIRELADLGSMPVWSVISAAGISGFPALPGIESIWIAADNDISGTGQRASRFAAERLNAAGIETIILASTTAGADLNDKVARHA